MHCEKDGKAGNKAKRDIVRTLVVLFKRSFSHEGVFLGFRNMGCLLLPFSFLHEREHGTALACATYIFSTLYFCLVLIHCQ